METTQKAISAYVLSKPFGDHKEGDVVHLDSEEAAPLVEAGYIAEATQDDIQGGGDEEKPTAETPEENEAITRAFNRLSTGIKKEMETQFAKIAKAAKPGFTVPAEPKREVFSGIGELCLSMTKAKKGDINSLKKLTAYEDQVKKKAPLGANVGTNSQGGYFLKPEWYREVFDKVRDYPKLLDLCDRTTITGNTLNVNAINETGLADGSRHGGVRGYWLAEAATATSSFPATTQIQLVINPYVVFAYATNQLLIEANIESWQTKFLELAGKELLWGEDYALLNGSGSQQPTGILNMAPLVTVAKDSTNDIAGGMFDFQDLSKMYRSLYPGSRRNAVWLMNPELYASLMQLAFVTQSGTATTYPARGLTYNFMDEEVPLRIFGKPVYECLFAAQAGAVGDIILADLSQIAVAEHQEIYIDVSEHIQFATLQTAFRMYKLWDHKSMWASSLASYDGNYNYSHIVALASRGT